VRKLLCPLDWRYCSEEMRKILSEEYRVEKMIEVEKALLEVLHEIGLVSKKCIEKIRSISLKDIGGLKKIQEIEKETKHDIMALVIAISEHLGECGNMVHFGATSNDIIDTSWALVIRDALGIIKKKTIMLLEELIRIIKEHKDTLMVGRTHAQHALPITFGFKIANHALEIALGLERLLECEKRVLVGKMSGAVGTMAAWLGKGIEIEKLVMEKLGLKPAEITTQVVSRDRHAELICEMSILASSIARLAEEIRNLQRPEIMEVAEGFSKGQVGSSTMPHKRNPIKSERICGLARIMRGLVIPALENIVLWHERDLTNSSSERIIITHAFGILDQILEDIIDVVKGLVVYPENMMRNLEVTRGANMAESIMIRLTLKGVPRNTAYRIVKELSMRSHVENRDLKDILLESDEIRRYLSEEEVEEALNPAKYLGNYRELIERAIKRINEILERAKSTLGES